MHNYIKLITLDISFNLVIHRISLRLDVRKTRQIIALIVLNQNRKSTILKTMALVNNKINQ